MLTETITDMRHKQVHFIDHTLKLTLHTNKGDEALQPKDVREKCTQHQRSRFLKIAKLIVDRHY